MACAWTSRRMPVRIGLAASGHITLLSPFARCARSSLLFLMGEAINEAAASGRGGG